MFTKYILIKDSEERYLSYDEEAKQEWYWSHNKSKAHRFGRFLEFERIYDILQSSVLYGHTDFYVEFMYVSD